MIKSDIASTDVYLVDDDAGIRQLISTVLSRNGYKVTCFASGPSLLNATRQKSPACILLDINLPACSGLDILSDLNSMCCPAPVLIVSGRNEVSSAVAAFKMGAHDYIEKPFHGSEVLHRVNDAIINSSRSRTDRDARANIPGYALLTEREQQILGESIGGATAKEVAGRLHLSHRTVEDYRTRIMQKLGAKNTADAIRIALTAGIRGIGP